MARRIRRPGVVWLPLTTENRMLPGQNADSQADTGIGQYALVTTPDAVVGDEVTGVFAVVADQPANVVLGTTSLADVEGSAYRLRRIVGKIWVEFDQQNLIATGNVNDVTAVIVTAGFIVLEVERTQNFLPKSATQTDYSASRLDNTGDPWIWRRSWYIGSGRPFYGAQNPVNLAREPPFSQIPTNNCLNGSVMDGPHVDAKTARVIKDEERLALVLTATNVNGGVGGDSQVIAVTTDLRVLGSMRKMSGNRGNSSR